MTLFSSLKTVQVRASLRTQNISPVFLNPEDICSEQMASNVFAKRSTLCMMRSGRLGFLLSHPRRYYRFPPKISMYLSSSLSSSSSSGHGNQEKDSWQTANKNVAIDKDLKRRIDDALIRSKTYTEDQEIIREWWRGRLYSKAGLWNIFDISKSIWARKLPLKAACIHAVYSTAITADFMYKHYDGVTESRSDIVVEHILEHTNIFAGCTGFLATALFLMLSFRINRGVSRWWEGRRLYGEMLGNLRGLAHASRAYMREKKDIVDIGILAYAYARATELHLRRNSDAKYLAAFSGLLSPTETEQMCQYSIRPYYIAEKLTSHLSDAFDRGDVKGIRALVAMQDQIQRIIRNTEGLHRIRATPEPWSYQKHMRFTAMLWLGILPLALLPSLLWSTPLLATSIGYVVFKLDDISVELQNPFGFDRSDLSICLLNDDFQKQIGPLLYGFAGDRIPNSENVLQGAVDSKYDRRGLSHDI